MNPTIARQMFTAEVLKLRRQRALMAFAAFLSVGTVVLFMGYVQLRHASNPSQYGPAGGVSGFTHLIRLLGVFFGALTAILIGSEAGTVDQSSGVFRDLVATGRSRLALFFVRLPAAIAVTLAFTAAGFAVGLLGVFLFAGGGATPSLSIILQGAGWVALANVVLVAVAVSVGAFTGSRAITLTALIGLQTIVTQLLLGVSSLGSVRDILITPSLSQLVPVGGGIGGDIAMSTGVAVAVLAGWALIPTAIAAWRTNTRDA
jgi:ABC-type transport system involved in multi-copper enzyme maturation permease subunit